MSRASAPLTVVVLDDYQQVARTMTDWSALGDELELVTVAHHIDDEAELLEVLRDAEVVVAMRERTPLSTALLEKLPALRLVITTGARNASVHPPARIPFSGTGSLTSPTVELTWALILAAHRNLDVELPAVAAGGWQSTIGEGLEDRTLGIIGLGSIGTRVAAVARSFGMPVLAWSENLTDEAARAGGADRVDRDELLSRSDVVSIHTRLSDRTRGLLGRRELDLIGSQGILVNTSRAEIVDQAALVDALTDGTLGGAALDVYDAEPLPADHPLRSTPRALLSPHLGYVTRQNYELFFGEVVEDIVAYRAGAPIRLITP